MSLFRIVYVQGEIPDEVGPNTLSHNASLKPVGRRDPHPGLPTPACHTLAAVTLMP